MAKFFGILANGGILNEQRLMSEEAIRRVTKPIVAGFDCSFGINSKWSLGTQLFTVLEGNKPVSSCIFGQHHVKTCLQAYVDGEGPDPPVHLCSLIKPLSADIESLDTVEHNKVYYCIKSRVARY